MRSPTETGGGEIYTANLSSQTAAVHPSAAVWYSGRVPLTTPSRGQAAHAFPLVPTSILRAVSIAVALTGVFAACPHARAYEDQLTLGAGLGYAYRASDTAQHGPVLSLDASLGLSPSWSTRAWLGYSFHPGSRPQSRAGVGAELFYLFDVLAVVPYIGAGIDGLLRLDHDHDPAARTASTRVDFGVYPVLGVDWLLSRTLIVGAVVRPSILLTDLDHEPLYLTVMLTASIVRDR